MVPRSLRKRLPIAQFTNKAFSPHSHVMSMTRELAFTPHIRLTPRETVENIN